MTPEQIAGQLTEVIERLKPESAAMPPDASPALWQFRLDLLVIAQAVRALLEKQDADR